MNPAAKGTRAASPIEGWNAFLEQAPGGSVYQAEIWGEIMGLSGWHARLLVLRSGESIRAGCLFATKKLPGLPRTIAVVPRGMVLGEETRDSTVVEMLELIRSAAREARSISIQLGVARPMTYAGALVEEGCMLADALKHAGCRVADQHAWSTSWVDLTQTDEEILAAMSSTARRHLRSCEREGVVVAEGNAPEDLERFSAMHAELYRGKGITETPDLVLSLGAAKLVERGYASIFWARQGERCLSSAVVSLVGIPRFFWGGRDLSPETAKGPPSGYLLHFRIMQALRARGKRTYDLGGSFGVDLDPSHPNYGVWRFKKSLGGQHVDFVEGQLVLSPLLAGLRERVEPIYRRLFPVSPYFRDPGAVEPS
jgi:hypothetical protein